MQTNFIILNTSIYFENLAYLVRTVAEQTCVTSFLSANRSSSVPLVSSTLIKSDMNFTPLVILLISAILASSILLHPVFYRPTPCPHSPHLLSPFLYLIILPTCPPPTQPVTSEDEEEEELFTCPGTGTFPTRQDCDSFYLCSVQGQVRQMDCVRAVISISFRY